MSCPHQHLATSQLLHCRILSTAQILVPILSQSPLRLYNTPCRPKLPGTPVLYTARRGSGNRPLPRSTRRPRRPPKVYTLLQPWPLRTFPSQTMRARSQTVATTLVRQWLCLASFIDDRIDQQGGDHVLQPLVEKPRFHILRDACVKQDYFDRKQTGVFTPKQAICLSRCPARGGFQSRLTLE
ncbi:hypothetical protein F5883DRAFT_569952 [Diaporthe sp. PMI_573]|nr:hypothetical protein F5883DRAFT_569952 [Diaporthaceae sp. PMI_573]